MEDTYYEVVKPQLMSALSARAVKTNVANLSMAELTLFQTNVRIGRFLRKSELSAVSNEAVARADRLSLFRVLTSLPQNAERLRSVKECYCRERTIASDGTDFCPRTSEMLAISVERISRLENSACTH